MTGKPILLNPDAPPIPDDGYDRLGEHGKSVVHYIIGDEVFTAVSYTHLYPATASIIPCSTISRKSAFASSKEISPSTIYHPASIPKFHFPKQPIGCGYLPKNIFWTQFFLFCVSKLHCRTVRTQIPSISDPESSFLPYFTNAAQNKFDKI